MKPFCFLVLALTTQLFGADSGYCPSAVLSNTLVVGRDQQGVFIRTHPASPYGSRPVEVNVQPIGDQLAREAGAAVFYMGYIAERPVAGEWRGRTPFEALKALAEAGGLAAVAPKSDFWVVGQERFVSTGAVQIFAYPIDPSSQRTPWAKDIEEVEKSLVAQLPLRELGVSGRLAVGYYWLPAEGSDVLLAIATQPPGGTYIYQPATVFKVKLKKETGGIGVECLWGAQASGYLLSGIDEDFDGDGQSDFVFRGDEDWPDEIVSGADGHVLARMFATDSLAVEKKTSGVKRFAGGDAWETPGSGARVFRYSEEEKAFRVPGLKATRQNRDAMLAEAARITKEVAAASKTPERDPVKVLGKELGSAQNVRLYIFPSMRGPSYADASGAEVVRLSRPNFATFISEQIKAGSAGRVLYEYKSPGYLAAEEKRKQAAARN